MRLSFEEIATGVVFGEAPSISPGSSPIDADLPSAFERPILDALRRPPCLVSFSGGLDSSVVLAAAVRVARRVGLPMPIPITWRFPDAPLSDETTWQEHVVSELDLDEWERLTATDELDLIGPVARRALERHGALYPANAFLHLPLLERARGGTLLTGVGGDEILGLWPWRQLADARAKRRPREPRDALRWAAAGAPAFVRRRRTRHGLSTPLWLRPGAQHALYRSIAAERADEPSRWDERVLWQARRRSIGLGLRSLELLAGDAGASAVHPFLDRRFLGALAIHGGRDGFGDRRRALSAASGDRLPRALATRRSKARFHEVFWTGRARELAMRWDGSGVDERLVDARALRQTWQSGDPDRRTALLLQHTALMTGWTGSS